MITSSTTARRGILVFLKYFSLVFITFCILLPLVSCVWTAAKTDAEYKTGNVMAMPHNWFNFSNYVEAFKLSNMAVAFRNSFIVLVCVCFMTTIIGTQLAYVLSRFQFPGNAFIRGAFTIAALLPGGRLEQREQDAPVDREVARAVDHRRLIE